MFRAFNGHIIDAVDSIPIFFFYKWYHEVFKRREEGGCVETF